MSVRSIQVIMCSNISFTPIAVSYSIVRVHLRDIGILMVVNSFLTIPFHPSLISIGHLSLARVRALSQFILPSIPLWSWKRTWSFCSQLPRHGFNHNSTKLENSLTSLTSYFSNFQPLYPDLLWQYGEIYGPHLSMLFLNALDKIHVIAKEAKYWNQLF